MKRVFATVLSLFAVGTAQATAIPVNGYVCSAVYTPENNPAYGNGYVQLTLYSNPKCAGSEIGQYYYNGSGASNLGFQFSEAERLQLFERAVQASTQGVRLMLVVQSLGHGVFHTTYYAN
jgi:hypothetical protein